MISEGMAKRVSNKLVNKSLAEGAQKSTWGEIAKDAALGGVANLIGGPGAGVLAVVGKNALRGGTGSTIMKNLTRKATDEVLGETIEKATAKVAEKTLPRNMKTQINELSPKLYNTYNSFIERIKNARPERTWKTLWMQKPDKKDIIDALKNPLIYIQPGIRERSPIIEK